MYIYIHNVYIYTVGGFIHIWDYPWYIGGNGILESTCRSGSIVAL